MKQKLWWIICGLALFIAGYSIVQYLLFDAQKAGFVQLKLMLNATLHSFWYIVLYIHIVFGVLALVIGPFTLSSKLREQNVKRHRLLGNIYMVSILFGGLAGLYLALNATGGWVAQLGFTLLSIGWLFTMLQALVHIKKRNIQGHQKWMLRNYALTFAAVTLRIWLPLFTVLFGFNNFQYSYASIAWLCWVPNLIVMEWYIQRKLIASKDKGYVTKTT
ncbi:DUF2306 domain-containing protein [Lysinibacillus sp. HST-98]|uniref:DUF2306 domain-containing protein n=1 Tax=Lysinibacillus sp. HST-98 TaxID=2800419 RepID=UPI001926A182|nr:DUF2306 domain-containing protein [Lysinibacillus sp. HST-98]MBL3730548.1 DUF2306 domain-containing protein [Lysinibacillus sp. HST-98]